MGTAFKKNSSVVKDFRKRFVWKNVTCRVGIRPAGVAATGWSGGWLE